MRIGLVPTDDRPVNTSLPAMIAAVAGARSIQPPPELLGRAREPGRPDEIAAWLRSSCGDLDALVVSLEMLLYGGLIASRTTTDPASLVLGRINPLLAIREQQPRLRMFASSLVLRASDSYSDAEEPAYWSRFGREVHAFGGALHRTFRGEPDDELARLRATVPAEIRRDFLSRRLRNHLVNLEAVRLLADDRFDLLALTSDDTAVYSAGSLEQEWLAHWVAASESSERALLYPGADEVGSILTARALGAAGDGEVSFSVRCLEPDGLERVASFENVPVRETIGRQIAASGGRLAAADEAAAVELVVHAPAGNGEDWFGAPPIGPAEEIVTAVADEVATLVARGSAVALADLRYTNGADPWLVDAIRDRCDLLSLTAYAGWNTAGNSLGTVVAQATAVIRGQRHGTFDRAAQRRLLAHRYLEDCVYQTRLRAEVARELTRRGDIASFVSGRLELEARRLFPAEALHVPAETVRLPWGRAFEIDFSLALDHTTLA